MKHMLFFCVIMVNIFINSQAQSNKETVVAIEEFVAHFSDNANSSQNLYFCVSFLPADLRLNLPTKVAGFKCIYFSTENREKIFKKMLRKNDNGWFYTIKVQTKSQDTIDFLFVKVDVEREQGNFEVFAECRGMLPITPDIRIINTPDGKRIIQSRIIEINKTGIKREIELQ